MRGILYILGVIFITLPSYAQKVKFQAKVSQSTVAVGERFKLTYELNTKGEQFTSPKLPNFQILSGPNQSTSMQWINGNATSSISYSYILSPTKTGNFTIPAARIKANGKVVSSNTLNIKVVKARTSSNNNQNTQNNRKQQVSNQLKDNVFIKVYIDKQEAYVGEEIIATYKVYTRLPIVNNNADKIPAFNGFYTNDVEVNSQLKPTNINGVKYDVATIKQTVLYPQHSGELVIDPLEMNLVVRVRENRRSRSVFDQFFGGYRDYEYKAVSNSHKIKVKNLPGNKPGDFNGSVGTYSLVSSIDKDSVATNEAINLKVTLSGKGNLNLLDLPEIQFPPDFEVYDPKINEYVSINGGGQQGKKTFEYLIIPRYPGKYRINPIQISFFDPKAKSYKTLSSKTFEIKVGKGENADESSSTFRPRSKEDVQFIGKDIRFIKLSDPKLKEVGQRFFGSLMFWSLLIIPTIIFGLFFLVSDKLESRKADIIGSRKRNATRVANKHLATAKKHIGNSDTNLFYDEVSKAIFGYLSDKFSISMADLSRDSVAEFLSNKTVSEEIVKEILEFLDDCDMARFAPAAQTGPDIMFEKAKELIHKTESLKV